MGQQSVALQVSGPVLSLVSSTMGLSLRTDSCFEEMGCT